MERYASWRRQYDALSAAVESGRATADAVALLVALREQGVWSGWL